MSSLHSNVCAMLDLYSLCPEHLPGRLDVSVQVLLGRFPGAHPVPGVVVGEDVAVDARAEADVEAAHLSEVHGVPVREEQRVAAAWRAAHEHTEHAVPAARARAEHLHGVQLALGVLPVRALAQVQAARAFSIRVHRIRRLRGQEGQLSGDAARAGRAAEQPTQLAQGEAVHSRALLRH